MIGSKLSLSAAFLSLVALNSSGAMAHHWFNWQFDIECEATGFFAPETETELVEFVKEQYPKKSLLRPVGNGHGFGNLTTCVNDDATDRDSYILSLTNLKHLEVFENNTAVVGGGWDLIDLIPALQESGLQVSNLGSEMVQNYIGAATTGTHGTGKQYQNLANQVLGLRVLDAKGDIHVITEDTPDLLKAYRIGIGALGIVVETTIQGEPLTFLRRTTEVVSVPEDPVEMYKTIAAFGEKYEQVNIIGPNMEWNITQNKLVTKPSVTLVYWEATNYTGATNCSVDYCANDCGHCDRDYVCYDYKNYAVATPPQGICYRGFMGQFEHFFPIENLAAAGTDYWNYAMSQSDRMIPYHTEDYIYDGTRGYISDDVTVITRFVKGDNNWLSPVNMDNLPANYSGIFATLEYSWVPTYNNYTLQYFYQELLEEFIPAFGEKHNVRAHWNKMQFHNGTYTEFLYPKMSDWMAIQEENDPNCQFVNPFLTNAFSMDRCKDVFEVTVAANLSISSS